jgi:hypothetical protein
MNDGPARPVRGFFILPLPGFWWVPVEQLWKSKAGLGLGRGLGLGLGLSPEFDESAEHQGNAVEKSSAGIRPLTGSA